MVNNHSIKNYDVWKQANKHMRDLWILLYIRNWIENILEIRNGGIQWSVISFRPVGPFHSDMYSQIWKCILAYCWWKGSNLNEMDQYLESEWKTHQPTTTVSDRYVICVYFAGKNCVNQQKSPLPDTSRKKGMMISIFYR